MLRSLNRFLQQVEGGTLKLLLLGGSVLLLWGIFAPVGTLVWWLNQGRQPLETTTKRESNSAIKPSTSTPIDCYIVYLPGVGDYSANQLTSGEEFFLRRLTQQYPNCVAVSDVFPYSVSNESLNGQRFLAPIWTTIEQSDNWLKHANVLIRIRNLWRFAISADNRYGQIYNQGMAMAVLDRMNAAHPISASTRPLKVVLIGTSGGVQVALGAAEYLGRSRPDLQLFVVSIGGDFEGNVGFDAIKRIDHLTGENDWIEDLSAWLFPSRWGVTVGSPFNQAKRQGRYETRTIGPQEHDGERGYFGLAQVPESHTTYVELTLEQVKQLPIWSASAKATPKP